MKAARVGGWILVCERCEQTWVLEVSFDLRNMKRIYHYCPHCKMNTFHEIKAAKHV
jgi:hypothetical protein